MALVASGHQRRELRYPVRRALRLLRPRRLGCAPTTRPLPHEKGSPTLRSPSSSPRWWTPSPRTIRGRPRSCGRSMTCLGSGPSWDRWRMSSTLDPLRGDRTLAGRQGRPRTSVHRPVSADRHRPAADRRRGLQADAVAEGRPQRGSQGRRVADEAAREGLVMIQTMKADDSHRTCWGTVNLVVSPVKGHPRRVPSVVTTPSRRAKPRATRLPRTATTSLKTALARLEG